MRQSIPAAPSSPELAPGDLPFFPYGRPRGRGTYVVKYPATGTKVEGNAPGLANARPPGRAKLDEAPLPGLTRGANAPQLPGGGGGLGAAGID